MITATEEVKGRWKKLQQELELRFGKEPDLNAVLLLIGIREFGQLKKKWSKEDKVNLMHIAVCRLLSSQGYYELKGLDKDGWPHWEAVKKLPFINVMDQEIFLTEQVVDYFDNL